MTPFECMRRIPLFRGRDPGDFAVEPLAGITNRSYRIAVDDEFFVLKIPGAHTDRFVDRRAETRNADIAAAAGVAPAVLWRDAETGAALAAGVKGGRALQRDDLHEPAMLRRAVELLRTLHRSGQPFAGVLDPCRAVRRYMALAGENVTGALPYLERLQELRGAVGARLAPCVTAVPRVPSHVDPVAENFLWDGVRLWLIDFEYAAMADPMWDLAYLVNEAGLDTARREDILDHYFGSADALNRARLRDCLMRIEAVNLAWVVLQIATRNDSIDFQAEFERRAALLRQRLRAGRT